jgi:hypothetical protein
VRKITDESKNEGDIQERQK